MPPLTGVAVKFTVAPLHIAPAGLTEMVTAGVSMGLTCIAVAIDVAVAGEAQTALEVMITDMISPFDNVEEE